MNILILNGSPRINSKSCTISIIYHIFKHFKDVNIKILDISNNIEKIENNNKYLNDIISKIKKSDAIIWSCPVYVGLVPSQLKRFIELIFEKKLEYVFKDKYSISVTSSIKFFDHFAHYYLQGICDDLDMRYIGYYSADVEDPKISEERIRMKKFGEMFIESVKNNASTIKKYPKIITNLPPFTPEKINKKIDIINKNIIILSDYQNNNSNLSKMVTKFKDHFNRGIEEINLAKQNIKFGCQGCFNCTYDNTCTLKDKDDFDKMFKEKLIPADIIILAFEIKDRYYSARVKQFFDRCYFMNHVPYYLGKQLGLITSGPISQIHHLMEFMNMSPILGCNSVDVVSDENKDSPQINHDIETLAKKIKLYSEKKYSNPDTFLKIGGRKIFRDNIWGRFRLIHRADHIYYKKHNLYDFPQKKIGLLNILFINIISLTYKNPKFRKIITNKIKGIRPNFSSKNQ